MQINIKKLPGSILEIEGELDIDTFESYFGQALEKLGSNIEIDGFRKGKVPENVLISKIPEIRVLEEMAELALAEYYPKIIEENKIDAIDRPEIAVTKLARKNPLGFKIRTAVLPEVKLPDYKKIAVKINKDKKTSAELEVSDKEVEDTIMDIRKSRAPKKHIKDAVTDNLEESKDELPDFNDEFVKTLGSFENVDDFTAKLRESIKLEKENGEREKNRLKIMEKIIEDSNMDLPEVLVNAEVDKILFRMETDITNMGLRFDDYLKQINKTSDDLRQEFKKDGEKRAKLALVMNEIAKLEKIEADIKEVEKEVDHLLEHYKDADPARARMHVENMLTNEKIFKFLEEQQ